jgi:hypothetical protein
VLKGVNTFTENYLKCKRDLVEKHYFNGVEQI